MIYSEIAELGVLADLLTAGTDELGNPMAWKLLDEIELEAADFYGGAHGLRGRIFDRMAELRAGRRAIDIITVSDGLDTEAKKLVRLLSEKELDSFNIHDHAKLVLEYAERRQLEAAGTELAKSAKDTDLPLEQIVTTAQQKVLSIGAKRGQLMTRVSTLVPQVRQNIGAGIMQGPGSGIVDWDNLTGGFAPARYSIIGGRPGMGKSSLAMAVAIEIAVRQKKGVVIFQLEDSAGQLVQRMVQNMAGVSKRQLLNNQLTSKERGRVNDALDSLANAPLYIDESKSVTVGSLLGRARRIATEVPLALLIVDYIQLLVRGEDRVGELSNISRQLAAAAGKDDLGCHVLAISQLSRYVESRPSKRPALHDLRDSGALEQDARSITFTFRPGYYKAGKKSTEQENDAELIVAKNNDGETGTAFVAFHGPTLQWRNLRKEVEPW